MSYETYTTVDWLMFFYIYCFLGWCFESTYVSIQHKKWINRGFMRGPFLPLYGSGAVIMLFVTIPVRDNVFLTFLFGAVGATILEYFTGAAMEALFKVRYWDYSNNRFNLNGHICLGTTIAWGFLTRHGSYSADACGGRSKCHSAQARRNHRPGGDDLYRR